MASLSEIYIKEEILDMILKTIRKKGAKGVGITINISDKSNAYGSNVSAFVSQSKEDREAKKEKFNVGFGKVFWTDGAIVKGEKPEGKVPQTFPMVSENDDDLPF
jgi:hypothetical protein